jgi:hypothetical protein
MHRLILASPTFCMSLYYRRPQHQPHDATERRLRVAMRMSQLASSRALIFLVGLICASFGLISLGIERAAMDHRSAAETELVQAGNTSSALPGIIATSQDEQILYAAIAGYGLLCLALAKFLYHAPMLAPILAMIGFVGTYVVFWKYNHSDSPTLYTCTCLLILGALIMAIRAGSQFLQSYSRMGRPDEK